MAYTPEGIAEKIRIARYAWENNETWEQSCARVANHTASVEDVSVRNEYSSRFYSILVNNYFCPGGRIWYAAGRPKGQLLNCYVIPTEDSREGWGKTVSDMIVISGTGGGVGINCSNIRPRGSTISGHIGKATGAVSLMDIVNAAGEVIRAGGGRRTALMLCLNVDHPDSKEFLDKKLNLGELNNANVSSVFMNESPNAFLRKVENDDLHHFFWNGEVIGSVPARELWASILDNAVKCGEPGVLNGWLANQENNIWYRRDLISTNPCGEIWLEPYGCCDLGALVLPRFVNGGQFDYKLFSQCIYASVRFLDNILDANVYPLKEIEENCKKFRRIGLGVMGLHDMLIKLGMKYSSDEALEFVDNLFHFLKKKAYRASSYLAAEKGQFPGLERRKFVESGFCKRALGEGILEEIVEHGIRNCAVMTIAPTGTTSIMSSVTSGIEPIYAYAYKRRYNNGDAGKESEIVEHPLFAEMKHDEEKIHLFESALELPPEKHLAMQAVCQKHVDNAISKTINLPYTETGIGIDKVVRKYIGELKGMTLYRDRSRGESPIEPLAYEDAVVLQDCPSGACAV